MGVGVVYGCAITRAMIEATSYDVMTIPGPNPKPQSSPKVWHSAMAWRLMV